MATRDPGALPIPPRELRELVGPTDPADYDNPSGSPVLGTLVPPQAYHDVLDLGSGCGRLARQLMQQARPPARYLGVDLHRGMVQWCAQHLSPFNPAFRFVHHDDYNANFNPGGRLPIEHANRLPADNGEFSLVVAVSVFTHFVESQAAGYLAEVSRVLAPDGWFIGTWLLFESQDFAVLPDYLHALYIGYQDPSGAVYLDRRWVIEQAERNHLTITDVAPPYVRGGQWRLVMRPGASDHAPAPWPEDGASAVRSAQVS